MRLVTRSVPYLWTPRLDMQWCVGLDDHADALRLQHLVNGVGDLCRQALLDLQPLGVGLDDPRQLWRYRRRGDCGTYATQARPMIGAT